MNQICASCDVKRYIDVVGRFSSTEIYTEISNQSSDIYDECGDPLSASKSTIEQDSSNVFYKEYYVGETRIYGIDRIYLGTTTKTEVSTADYEVSTSAGMIKLNSSTVGGVPLDTSQEIIIQYIPNIYSKYCAIKTADALLSKIDSVDKGKSSKELQIIQKRLEMIERLLNNKLGVAISSDYIGFDPVYGVNLKTVKQDHDANKYLWR